LTDIHILTVMQIAGLIFFIMPIITWIAIGRQGDRAILLWSLGGVLIGIGFLFIGLRPLLPAWLSFTLANLLLLLGWLIRIVSLRLELSLANRTKNYLIIIVLCLIWYELIRQQIDATLLRIVLTNAFGIAIFGYSGLLALRIHKIQKNRSAWWIAAIHFLLAGIMLLRQIELILSSKPADPFSEEIVNTLLSITYILYAIIAHIGYAGMKLEQISQQLTTAHKNYQSLIQTTADGFFVLDRDNRFIDINTNFCQMTGYSRDDLINRSLADIEANENQAAIEAHRQKIDIITFERFETHHRRKDGSIIDVEISATRTQDDSDRIIAFVRDISDRKQSQLELERRILERTAELATARAEAESANAVKTRFMSNVSHEMRTPMNSILGFAQIGQLKSQHAEREQLNQYFTRIHEAGNRLHRLLESLIQLSQDAWEEQVGTPLKTYPLISPQAIAIQAISRMEQFAAARQQKIQYINQSLLTTIPADEGRLRQVLEHLISNALRYSAEGSLVIVQITDQELQTLIIDVIDEGCGIPVREIDAIFEPFYESSRTASGAGNTGLGLALCRSIIRRHRGTITASNRAEGGTIFRITLPGSDAE
jgi:PAS domain S-box-containing protein